MVYGVMLLLVLMSLLGSSMSIGCAMSLLSQVIRTPVINQNPHRPSPPPPPLPCRRGLLQFNGQHGREKLFILFLPQWMMIMINLA